MVKKKKGKARQRNSSSQKSTSSSNVFSPYDKTMNKLLMKMTKGKPLNFVINCNGTYYDLTPLFASFMVYVNDGASQKSFFDVVDVSLSCLIRNLVADMYSGERLIQLNTKDIFALERASHKLAGDVYSKDFVGKLSFDHTGVFCTSTYYKLFEEEDRGYSCITCASKMSTYLRATTDNQKVSTIPLGILLDYLSSVFHSQRKGNSLEQTAKMIELPNINLDFLWLVFCGYVAIYKKYDLSHAEEFSKTFEEMLAERGDYTEILYPLKITCTEVDSEKGICAKFDYFKHSLEDTDGELEDTTDSLEGAESSEDAEEGYPAYDAEMDIHAVLWSNYARELMLRAESFILAQETALMNDCMLNLEKTTRESLRVSESAVKKTSKTLFKLEKAFEEKTTELNAVKEKLASNDTVVNKNKQIADLSYALSEAEKENQLLNNKLSSTQNRVKTLETRSDLRSYLENKVLEQEEEIERLNTLLAEYADVTEQTNTIPLAYMQNFLRDKKIMIVGGPVGFDKRLETIFNDFIYIDLSEKGSNFNAPDTLDCMVIISRKVAHAHVFRAEKIAKTLGIPYISVHVTNLDLLVRMIFLRLIAEEDATIE